MASSNGDRLTPAPTQRTSVSEYEKLFPPFFLQSHTAVAPCNRFSRDQEALDFARNKIDKEIVQNEGICSDSAPFDASDLLRLSPFKRRRIYGPEPSVKEIVERIYGTSKNPIDLTDTQTSRKPHNPRELLKSISTRYLKFAEDVRPPYIGTFTRQQDSQSRIKLSRNPFSRSLPATDYDYDSEIEWEEPEEGEDLESEGEEEIEDEEADEMEGFLDDTEATEGAKPPLKRRLIVGDLEPVCTGLCWEGEEPSRALASYRIEAILGELHLEVVRGVLLTIA